MPTIAEHALTLLADGMTIGLGTGRAANAFIEALGDRVRAGFKVRGVPTSEASAALARQSGIPLLSLAEAGELDMAFDGADEVAPNLDLIKGWGGALVREKIVAASARRFVVLVGSEKLVARLGERGKLPVEIVPFGLALCRRRLDALGLRPQLRATGHDPYVTDNGNLILDCGLEPIEYPDDLDARIRAIPGVVGTGLFVGMTDCVLVQDGDRVTEKRR
ncbi:MAG: ribose-5-phosphate isomerase RpiA [Gemmataceae bacterium]